MNNKKTLIAIVALLVLAVGGTLAYFTGTVTVDNLFTVGDFNVEVIETFVSPTNWKPGDETAKEITAKNNGPVAARVRVKFEEKWEDENENLLPLTQNGVMIAQKSLANPTDWIKIGEYYYYNDDLAQNDVTSAIIDEVTFNPLFNAYRECNTNILGTTTCTGTGTEYENATYTLKVVAEFVQADSYEEAWGIDSTDLASPSSFELIFEPNGGTMTSYKQTVTNGETYSLPTATKTGYTLEGWYLDSTFTQASKIETGDTISLNEDKIVYAKWEI